MKNKSTIKILSISGALLTVAALGIWDSQKSPLEASSHREAPLIANDPLADNTDLYAFRSPDDTNTVTIIADFIPFELPQGGPNFANFGKDVRYEVHIENNGVVGDDITYRFTFSQENQDPSTFFNIRLGQQNLKMTYVAERSIGGGAFETIVTDGVVAPNNIGPRSISSAVGLGVVDYESLRTSSIAPSIGNGGEQIFCGPADDPFFVDLGGIFDLGMTRAGGTGVDAPEDGVACKNIHAIALKIPISTLQKEGKDVTQAANILDSEFIIGVWTSTSRQKIRTLNVDGSESYGGEWVQVSRLGMPLTNEVVIPIGGKDKWNARTPYNEDPAMEAYFVNPELALYMDDSQFGGAVPALAALRIQRNSLQAFDFGNGQQGLFPLKGTAAVAGTALDDALFGNYLLRANSPRSVDLLPIFHTGVPNLKPYQLATGKGGNPLAEGKPFINNFLPTFGDMLRLNMAVPVTPRNSPDFSSLGIIQAAVLGLTDPRFNSDASLQFIPNMDGFPNGRRLEDDVTRIELQAVSGIALAAIGLFYDDYTAGDANPVTPNLLGVYTYTTGVESNDTTFRDAFPYVQTPWSGFGECGGTLVDNAGNGGGGCFAVSTSDYTPGMTKNGMTVPAARMNPAYATGAPEFVAAPVINFVSLGFGGHITLAFDGPVANGDGADVRIHEATFGNRTCGNYKEQAEVFASQNGCDFIYVGTVCTNGGDVDLGALPSATYIKIHDISDASDFSDPFADGYDVNAIECLNGPGMVTDAGLVAGSIQSITGYAPGLRKNGTMVPAPRNNPAQAVGVPSGTDAINFVSLGFGGTVTGKFDFVVFNRPGNDIRVTETSYGNPSCANYPEKARVYGSQNGVDFVLLGDMLGDLCQDGEIDLGGFDWIQYVRVEDVSPMSSNRFPGAADGYDVDGITVLGGCDPSAKLAAPGDNVRTPDEQNGLTFSVYPNPVKDIVSVSIFGLQETEKVALTVTDINGRLVYSTQFAAAIGQSVSTFDVSALPGGVYQLTIRTQSGVYTERIVK